MNARVVLAAATVLTLVGCATPIVEQPPRIVERVVLLPSESDRPSAVVVSKGDAQVLLDTPYTTADLRGSELRSGATSAGEVKSRYGALLSAQPHEPEPFTIYFVLGSDELTARSRIAFDDARHRISTRSAAEVVVVGHTDRLGTTEYNDRLSWQRAKKVATQLVAAGVPADAIQIAARGEREPLVETGNGIPEPRNRRVEIKVR